MIGRALGPYEVLSKLGEGGMGEVYLARDAKLNRRVALKVLPPPMASDTARLERFRREAKAVAALNHPNIVTVHAVEHIDDVHFIALELVEGQSLNELIPSGGMPLERFFAIAIPLVDAVATAHAGGVVHRDLKPSNVMVTAEGRVKVLDFGLAKLLAPASGDDASTALGDDQLTDEGTVLGTVAYMSPEQAEGKPLDHRTDIFSLGILLYELATGTRPFTGDTRLSVMSSIVKDTPASVTALNAQLPRHLGRIIKKALEKKLTRRYQTALDLRNDLQELKDEIDSGELEATAATISDPEVLRPVEVRTRPPWVVPVVVGATALLAVLAWSSGWGRGVAVEPVPEYELTQLTKLSEQDVAVSMSPDGTDIIFERVSADGTRNIFRQSVPGGSPLLLTGDLGFSAGGPAVSPDGLQIAFHDASSPNGGIYLMSATGGNAQQVYPNGYSPSWSPDGTAIVFEDTRPTTGAPYDFNNSTAHLTVVKVDESDDPSVFGFQAVQPAWSPHGHRIAYWAADDGQRDVWTVKADGTDPVQVTNDAFYDYSPAWHPSGEWLYYCSTRGGTMAIWRVRIDEETGKKIGEPQEVKPGGPADPGVLSFSADGLRLVYREFLEESTVWSAAFDEATLSVAAERTRIWSGARRLALMDVSPDGQWLAFRSGSPQPDIFVVGTDGRNAGDITSDLAAEFFPRWSPNSTRLAYYSTRENGYQVWVVNRDGGRPMRLTDHSEPNHAWFPTWSPDGDRVIYELLRVGAYIVRSDARFDEQDPTLVPGSSYEDQNGQVRVHRAMDWHRNGQVLTWFGYIYAPGGDPAWSDAIIPVPSGGILRRFMPDGRRVFRSVNTVPTYDVYDPATGESTPIASPPGWELRLSSDGRTAFLISRNRRSDIWMLEFRE